MRYDNGVRFNSEELYTVMQALRVAGEVYKKDAASFRKGGASVLPVLDKVCDRLVAQFERQEAEVNRLARFIEEYA